MTIRQFSEGQTVYILGDGNAIISKKEPVAATVLKIGRKCVTVATIGRGEVQFEGTYIEDLPYLREKTECGAPRMLFPSHDAVAEYLEWEQLKRWVQQAAGWDRIGRYSLEQLREVRRILEGEHQGPKRRESGEKAARDESGTEAKTVRFKIHMARRQITGWVWKIRTKLIIWAIRKYNPDGVVYDPDYRMYSFRWTKEIDDLLFGK